jgi:hypothetical protein
MVRRYWKRIRGTLLEEYLVVPLSPGVGKRLIDAVIIVDGEHQNASGEHVSLDQSPIWRRNLRRALRRCGNFSAQHPATTADAPAEFSAWRSTAFS